jgi:hypothetical protein
MSVKIEHTRRIYGVQVKKNLTQFQVKKGLTAMEAAKKLVEEFGVAGTRRNMPETISRVLIDSGFDEGIIDVSKLNFGDLNQWITRRKEDKPNAQKADENCLPAIAATIGVYENVFEKIHPFSIQAKINVPQQKFMIDCMVKGYRELFYKPLKKLFERIPDSLRIKLLKALLNEERHILQHILLGPSLNFFNVDSNEEGNK